MAKGNASLSKKTTEDISNLCQYIFDTEHQDYVDQEEELGTGNKALESHPYAIAERVWSSINKEANRG